MDTHNQHRGLLSFAEVDEDLRNLVDNTIDDFLAEAEGERDEPSIPPDKALVELAASAALECYALEAIGSDIGELFDMILHRFLAMGENLASSERTEPAQRDPIDSAVVLLDIEMSDREKR